MTQFKIGDLVECVPNVDGRGRGSGYHPGFQFHVRQLKAYTRDDESDTVYWPVEKYGGSNLLGVFGDSLRLITDTEGGDMEQTKQRRTFKLLKESPSLLKGALVQERCDDGTQPYDLLNPETHSKDPSFKVSFAKRELVEEAPKFWVEVFPVQPQFMTREELDQFEAFKASKKPVRKAAAKKAAKKSAQAL
jgi:hypothetical protein